MVRCSVAFHRPQGVRRKSPRGISLRNRIRRVDMECAESIRVMHPLFRAGEGGPTPTSALRAKDLVIERIPFERAKELNRAWHSRLPRMGTGFIKRQPFLCFSARHSEATYAVAIWSNPVARNLPQQTWLELRRLATAPDAPRNTCSRMLRIMELLIRRERSGVVNLISYQDREVHSGSIYRAAGWKETAINQSGNWDRPSRSRPKAQSEASKRRWEKELA